MSISFLGLRSMEVGLHAQHAARAEWPERRHGELGRIFNTYYWLDLQRVTGLIMPQILPFADQRVLQLYGQFESAIYNAVKAA